MTRNVVNEYGLSRPAKWCKIDDLREDLFETRRVQIVLYV